MGLVPNIVCERADETHFHPRKFKASPIQLRKGGGNRHGSTYARAASTAAPSRGVPQNRTAFWGQRGARGALTYTRTLTASSETRSTKLSKVIRPKLDSLNSRLARVNDRVCLVSSWRRNACDYSWRDATSRHVTRVLIRREWRSESLTITRLYWDLDFEVWRNPFPTVCASTKEGALKHAHYERRHSHINFEIRLYFDNLFHPHLKQRSLWNWADLLKIRP